MCPRDSLVHKQWHSPSSWNIKLNCVFVWHCHHVLRSDRTWSPILYQWMASLSAIVLTSSEGTGLGPNPQSVSCFFVWHCPHFIRGDRTWSKSSISVLFLCLALSSLHQRWQDLVPILNQWMDSLFGIVLTSSEGTGLGPNPQSVSCFFVWHCPHFIRGDRTWSQSLISEWILCLALSSLPQRGQGWVQILNQWAASLSGIVLTSSEVTGLGPNLPSVYCFFVCHCPHFIRGDRTLVPILNQWMDSLFGIVLTSSEGTGLGPKSSISELLLCLALSSLHQRWQDLVPILNQWMDSLFGIVLTSSEGTGLGPNPQSVSCFFVWHCPHFIRGDRAGSQSLISEWILCLALSSLLQRGQGWVQIFYQRIASRRTERN